MIRIAVPFFPGSNGDRDAKDRIKEYGMKPVPLYFHIGDAARDLKNRDNAARMLDTDGVVGSGGFPYQDRLGFGMVPAKIRPFANALRAMADSGKPVIAFCSGNQVAHAVRLAFPQDSPYEVSMLPNICDTGGAPVHRGFISRRQNIVQTCSPNRTAFTGSYVRGDVMKSIIDHGGGRFWADDATLTYLVQNDLIVARYAGDDGRVVDNFPANPNGSLLNIESITNIRGNVKIGMAHNERKLRALDANEEHARVFESMEEFIRAGCPDLSRNAIPLPIPIVRKDYDYLSKPINPAFAVDIYVKMLTDDNEAMAARLLLPGVPMQRRRLLRMEVEPDYANEQGLKRVVTELAKMDFFDGVMLKKDLPTGIAPGTDAFTFSVVSRDPFRRDFVSTPLVVPEYPVADVRISLPNPDGYFVKQYMTPNAFLRNAVKTVHTGAAWFFKSERDKQIAKQELLG